LVFSFLGQDNPEAPKQVVVPEDITTFGPDLLNFLRQAVGAAEDAIVGRVTAVDDDGEEMSADITTISAHKAWKTVANSGRMLLIIEVSLEEGRGPTFPYETIFGPRGLKTFNASQSKGKERSFQG
jgi:hypothetical protein